MKKVLVIGETIEDVFVYSKKKGVSAETPTIVGYHENTQYELGGAANVVKNLQTLGCVVTFISNRAITGFSMNFFQKNYQLKKQRFFVDEYKLLQIDEIDKIDPPYSERLSFRIRLKEEIKDADVIIVSDYRHGLIDGDTAKRITSLCVKAKKPLFIDSQVSQYGSNHRYYRTKKPTEFVTFVLNENELVNMAGPRADIFDAQDILKGNIVLKKGKFGCDVVSFNSIATVKKYSAPTVNAVDTTGAGDCFLAALVATGSYSKANQWAATSVTYKGTKTPKVEDAKTLVGFSLDR